MNCLRKFLWCLFECCLIKSGCGWYPLLSAKYFSNLSLISDLLALEKIRKVVIKQHELLYLKLGWCFPLKPTPCVHVKCSYFFTKDQISCLCQFTKRGSELTFLKKNNVTVSLFSQQVGTVFNCNFLQCCFTGEKVALVVIYPIVKHYLDINQMMTLP